MTSLYKLLYRTHASILGNLEISERSSTKQAIKSVHEVYFVPWLSLFVDDMFISYAFFFSIIQRRRTE